MEETKKDEEVARDDHIPAPLVTARARYFSGGVTPAGSGTCATFNVIDTRL